MPSTDSSQVKKGESSDAGKDQQKQAQLALAQSTDLSHPGNSAIAVAAAQKPDTVVLPSLSITKDSTPQGQNSDNKPSNSANPSVTKDNNGKVTAVTYESGVNRQFDYDQKTGKITQIHETNASGQSKTLVADSKGNYNLVQADGSSPFDSKTSIKSVKVADNGDYDFAATSKDGKDYKIAANSDGTGGVEQKSKAGGGFLGGITNVVNMAGDVKDGAAKTVGGLDSVVSAVSKVNLTDPLALPTLALKAADNFAPKSGALGFVGDGLDLAYKGATTADKVTSQLSSALLPALSFSDLSHLNPADIPKLAFDMSPIGQTLKSLKLADKGLLALDGKLPSNGTFAFAHGAVDGLDKGVAFTDVFMQAASNELIQQPVNSVIQLVDHGGGLVGHDPHLSAPTIVDSPDQSEEKRLGMAGKIADFAGRGAAFAGSFLVGEGEVNLGLKGLGFADKAVELADHSPEIFKAGEALVDVADHGGEVASVLEHGGEALNATEKTAAATANGAKVDKAISISRTLTKNFTVGALTSFEFTPAQDDAKNFWQQKLTGAFSSGLNFAALGGANEILSVIDKPVAGFTDGISNSAAKSGIEFGAQTAKNLSSAAIATTTTVAMDGLFNKKGFDGLAQQLTSNLAMAGLFEVAGASGLGPFAQGRTEGTADGAGMDRAVQSREPANFSIEPQSDGSIGSAQTTNAQTEAPQADNTPGLNRALLEEAITLADGTPIDPAAAKIMRFKGLTPDSYVYRTTFPEFLNLENFTTKGNPVSIARIADGYGEQQELFPGAGVFSPRTIRAASLEQPGLNVTVTPSSVYPGDVTIRLKIDDILHAGGRLYNDEGAAVNDALYASFDGEIPFSIVATDLAKPTQPGSASPSGAGFYSRPVAQIDSSDGTGFYPPLNPQIDPGNGAGSDAGSDAIGVTTNFQNGAGFFPRLAVPGEYQGDGAIASPLTSVDSGSGLPKLLGGDFRVDGTDIPRVDKNGDPVLGAKTGKQIIDRLRSVTVDDKTYELDERGQFYYPKGSNADTENISGTKLHITAALDPSEIVGKSFDEVQELRAERLKQLQQLLIPELEKMRTQQPSDVATWKTLDPRYSTQTDGAYGMAPDQTGQGAKDFTVYAVDDAARVRLEAKINELIAAHPELNLQEPPATNNVDVFGASTNGEIISNRVSHARDLYTPSLVPGESGSLFGNFVKLDDILNDRLVSDPAFASQTVKVNGKVQLTGGPDGGLASVTKTLGLEAGSLRYDKDGNLALRRNDDRMPYKNGLNYLTEVGRHPNQEMIDMFREQGYTASQAAAYVDQHGISNLTYSHYSDRKAIYQLYKHYNLDPSDVSQP